MNPVMTALRSVVMAFSTFSRIPMPNIKWTEESMRYSMCAFPLIGLVVAALGALWLWICSLLHFGPLISAVGLIACAVLVSGGIHLDGFGDVVDALSSHAEMSRKIEILKDPHMGAFGATGIALYLLLMTAVLNELCTALSFGNNAIVSLCMVPVLCRAFSSISVLVFPRNASDGMFAVFQRGSHKGASLVIVIIELVVVCAVACAFCLPVGIAITVAPVIVLMLVKLQSTRQFGGYSGDVAGYFVCLAELVALATALVVLKVVVLL